MKRILILIFTIVFILFACNHPQKKEAILTVSIEPQRYFLEAIVEDKFTVNAIVPSASSPEAYEPSPAQMVALSQSRAYFKIGNLGFESEWTRKISETYPDMAIVDCSSDIVLIDNDPHVWTSPENAIIIGKNMLERMIEIDPENKSFYVQNFDKLTQRIIQTDSVLNHILLQAQSRAFFIFHPDLTYFAKQYDLQQHSLEKDGKHPTPIHLKNLIENAKRENIHTVFIQQGFDMKHAEVLAKETKAELFAINPLAYEWDEELIRIAKILTRNE